MILHAPNAVATDTFDRAVAACVHLLAGAASLADRKLPEVPAVVGANR